MVYSSKDGQSVKGGLILPGNIGEGDNGFTNRLDGSRVRKDHPTIELIGEIDELTAWIGLLRTEISDPDTEEKLAKIQNHLSIIMAVISGSGSDLKNYSTALSQNLRLVEGWLGELEKTVHLPHAFLVPGGASRKGVLANLARTVSRRVERRAVSALFSENEPYSFILAYLNRLSSYFYLLWLSYEQQ